ncbi:Bifunctional phosphatase IMPL2, chloroplastic [Symbiodinium microadriaticum]|uniref:Bifunctional phosphatase IMPL2, chloroplastic n=1 Tax=Symbiodinium microadriaticum TaxID=2951 RepID=A0A1Q9EPK5_SYMMI|nr:Bifunctional phosphatase IMPL2, chloroplastic [Symbiodinium microadriaticum]CAE6931901.1 HISN7 [Symbiodinium sp. KB8]
MLLPVALLLVLAVIWLMARWRARKQNRRDVLPSLTQRDNSSLPIFSRSPACDGVRNAPDEALSASWEDGKYQEASMNPIDKEILDNKFGAPRSELYGLTYYPIAEDVTALIQVAVRDASRHAEVEEKLEQLRALSTDLPGSGWVQPQDSRVLLRFLLARQCHVEEALAMLRSVLEWRQQSDAANVLPRWEKRRHEKLDLHWKALGRSGVDHEGDPVVFERVGQNDFPGLLSCDPEFLKQHTIYNAECVFASLELARRENLKKGSSRGFQFMVVVDMYGLDLGFMDRHLLGLLQTLGRVESDNYPEALKRIIVIRPPWIFPWIWRVCRPFLDQGTIEKVEVVDDSETTEALLRHIPAESVPKALGGKWFDGNDDYCSKFIEAQPLVDYGSDSGEELPAASDGSGKKGHQARALANTGHTFVTAGFSQPLAEMAGPLRLLVVTLLCQVCSAPAPSSGAEGQKGSLRGSVGMEQVLVFDAGSSGTRIHIFNMYVPTADAHVPRVDLAVRDAQTWKVKPGLSEFAKKEDLDGLARTKNETIELQTFSLSPSLHNRSQLRNLSCAESFAMASLTVSADLVNFSEELADAAGNVIRQYWRKPVEVESKLEYDRPVAESPVTIADREAEKAMRDLIELRYPSHGIIGEEFGSLRQDAEWVWVLDPIDGTKSFITGKPLFGTLIALLRNGVPALGIIDQCVLGERWLGANGRTTLNGKAVQARGAARLEDAMMYATTPHMFGPGHEEQRFSAIRSQVKRPLYGCDCYAYGLVASGFGADLVIEADLGIYDYCALVPVVICAGGRMTDWSGQPLTLQSHELSRGRVVAAANDTLWKAAVSILSMEEKATTALSRPCLSSLLLGAALGAASVGALALLRR